MADKKDDLPGFYRDPKTGKYFREKPESVFNPSLKKLRIAAKENAAQDLTSIWPHKIDNPMQYMRSTELGFVSGLNAEREYFKMKTRNKCLKEEFQVNRNKEHKITSIDLLKGARNSLICVWNVDETSPFCCVVGLRPIVRTEDTPPCGLMGAKSYVVDVCSGPRETVFCLFNDPETGAGSFYLFPVATTNLDTFISCKSSPLFCCAPAREGVLFAFGCEGFIRFYNKFSCENTYYVRGRVHSIAFNKSGNTMVSGVHNGNLYVHDVRQKRQVMEFPVSDNCVTDLSFVNTDQVIVAGANNMLKKVDLRVQKPVSEYLGHKSSVKKLPLSIANDMLCAPGSDNIVRIWHLDGGNPVHEVAPIKSPENSSRGWLHGDGNKTYLYHYELDIHRKYEISRL